MHCGSVKWLEHSRLPSTQMQWEIPLIAPAREWEEDMIRELCAQVLVYRELQATAIKLKELLGLL